MNPDRTFRMNPVPREPAASLITRREALRRAALVLGAALSPSIVAGALQAQVAAGAKPRHLSAAQFETAAAVAERILPRTDTPGAGDVGVPAFIDLMVGGYLTAAEKRVIETGLAEVEAAAAKTGGRRFAQLTPPQQDDLLRILAAAAPGKPPGFFHLFRELTITGYFTSEPVGRNVLHYDPIPGGYQGCIPLADVGNRSWTR